MAERNWNPDEPFVLGMEWPGMRTLALPLSQEVEYGHTFQANATETIDAAAFEIVGPSANIDSNATALVTVYHRDSNDPAEAGDELEYGIVHSTMVPVNGGAVTAPASLQNTASLADALATPSDYKYVLILAGGGVALNFATAGVFTGKRILELKLHYSATTLLDGTDPLAVMFLNVNGTLPLTGSVDINPPTYSNREIRVVSLGEVNYPDALVPLCWPWTVADVGLFDTTTGIEFLTGAPVTEYGLEYVALEVVWCEENRAAVGGLLMGSFTALGKEPMTLGVHTVNLRTPAGVDNWVKTLNEHYAVTVTSARSPGIGNETRGTQPMIPLVDSFTVFENHQGRVSPRLPSNVLGALGLDTRLAPIKFVTTGATIPTDFAPYDKSFGAHVFNGTFADQEIEQRSGGTIDYPWLRFYARIIGDPDEVTAIDITTVDGTMNYFASALLALPEIFDGWRQVTIRWPAGQEPSMDNTGTNKTVTFSTTQGNIRSRWEILGVDSIHLMDFSSGGPTYGGGDTQATHADMDSGGVELARPYADLVVTMHSEPPAVTNFTAVPAALSLSPPEYCGNVPACMVADFYVASLDWDNTTLPADEFAYYEVQRKDVYDPTYRTVAKLTTIAGSSFSDHEARSGVTSTYRVRICRVDGICGAWTADDAVAIPETAATGGAGTLMFTTNANVNLSPVVYSESFESAPAEAFGFVEAEWVTFQRFFGRFGQQSFHPTERGGVRFERTMLVNALATPTRTADEAFRALRDLAYADVPYVCVKDDLGNRWYATLTVPDGNVRRSKQIFLASIQVTESTDVPFPVATQTP